MAKNMYLDLHVIQTVPPSCVNRDDTGSPKTAIYGGTMRARVSSQAWKRAMRVMFRDLFESEYIGFRTKNSVKLVSEEIRRNNTEIDEETSRSMASGILELAGAKAGSDKKDVLFFISAQQIKAIAVLAQELADAKKNVSAKEAKNLEKTFKPKAEAALLSSPSIDILLFGRMAASNPVLNFDAAAQVAHSISTHTVSNEYDYFTAVDDFGEEDNAGAGHLGTVEYNSSTLYRYATVNIGELAKNLTPEELALAARGFAEAFIRSMPTGKQNTFANRTLPNLVYATIREDQPINLAGAFERPIPAGNEGYVKKSEEALFQYASSVYEDFVAPPVLAWSVGSDADGLAERISLTELLSNIEETVAAYSADGE